MATETVKAVRDWGNYIGGEWVHAADGATIDVYNPCTEELLARVPSMSRDEARAAIAAATEQTGLPADDPVRYGAGRLLDAVLAARSG